MTDWRSKRDSRRSAISRGIASDRKWGLPPLKKPNATRREEQTLHANLDLAGTVAWFDEDRQFGFAEMEGMRIESGSRGVFVHNKQIVRPKDARLRLGKRITADVVQTEKGPRAVNIRIM